VPVPRTYFVAHPNLLTKIPEQDYPLVVKPANGSACRGVYRLNSPADLTRLESENLNGFFLAQRYVENPGYDVKLYVIGKDVYAVAKKSPLHPEMAVKEQLLPLAVEWRRLARRVGEIFGLDIYGLDVLETRNGPVVVDINDFPSFGHVPGAVGHVASYILRIAEQARSKRRRNKALVMQAFTALKPILQDGQLSKRRVSRTSGVNLPTGHPSAGDDGALPRSDITIQPDTHDAA
jgi:ribosomal protein S6--L-glutamate ligase